MVKKFTIPFASQGDANDIPDALQVDGKVSFTQGFGYDYERPYDDPQAKDIAREDMNGLFKAITSAVGELQTLGASEWSSAISYPKGAIVYYEKDLYISQVDDNQNTPPQSWVSITSIANDSLKKAANLSDLTNKATARNNLGLGSSATLNKTDVLGTSTSLVATQKLVNDTKINLESSKQDKLTFVGDGPEVMRSGAYGLGSIDSTLDDKFGETRFAYLTPGTTAGELLDIDRAGPVIIHTNGIRGMALQARSRYVTAWSIGDDGESSSKKMNLWHDQNTTIDSSGFLRTSGNKETFTKDLVSQSTGSSTTNVMSQKAVTDQLNAIESGHGLGYGQSWVDVTSQRVAGTTYTNNTGKPIYILAVGNNRSLGMDIDGVRVSSGGHYVNYVGGVIPNNAKYKVFIVDGSGGLASWAELR